MQGGTPRRQRLLLVHSSDELYGADRIILQVMEALDPLDVDVEVWLPSDVEHGRHPLCELLSERGYAYSHRDLPVLRRQSVRPRGWFGLTHRLWKTGRALRRERPDLVYLSSSACLLLAPVARLVGVGKCVLHVQEHWTGRSAAVLRVLARPTTSRIAISRFVAESARLTDPAAVVIPNGVDDASERVDGKAEREGAELRYVVASRWNRWKGHRTLIDAWGLAGCPGRLVVLGGPPSSGDAVDVAGLIAGLDRPETVELIGEVDDVAPYLAGADVLVLPSDQPEPFGLVIIEAFSLGRPVIASRAGGPIEIIDSGRTGWLFESGRPERLAELFRGLERDDVAAAGCRARRAYVDRFTSERYRHEVRIAIERELDSVPRADS